MNVSGQDRVTRKRNKITAQHLSTDMNDCWEFFCERFWRNNLGSTGTRPVEGGAV